MRQPDIASIADVCEVSLHAPGADTDRPASLLIELPHGATRAAEFEAIASRLRGELPHRIEEFFFVNTDVGSVECARRIAELLASGNDGHAGNVMILRSLIPRTLIDCNRIVDTGEDGMTPGLPPYVTHGEDRRWLSGLHESYVETAGRAYREVCGSGGLALNLHTYAPRSVGIDTVDADIVKRLHRAYAPDLYETWPTRPDVDIITEDTESNRLASAELVGEVKQRYAREGIEATENGTYRLHRATLGYHHSRAYPGRVLCVEINRGLLADPFTPFREMRISATAVDRLSRPLASALAGRLSATR